MLLTISSIVFILLLSHPSQTVTAAAGAEPTTTTATSPVAVVNTLFDGSASVIDIHASARLSLITPAADSCPWVLLMYDSMCGHCRTFSVPFAKLAAELSQKGFLVAAVNCAAEEKICVASNVSSVPVVYVGSPKKISPLLSSPSHSVAAAGGALPDLVRDAKQHVRLEKYENQNNKNDDDDDTKPSSSGQTAAAAAGILSINKNHGWYEATANLPPADGNDNYTPLHLRPDNVIFKNIRESTNFLSSKHGLPLQSLCKDVARTLRLKKMQLIRHQKENVGGEKNFVPPRVEPCHHDLVGALFVAMRHEVVMAPRTLPNWWVLLQFLTTINAALPGLGAGNILRVLKADRNAPLKATWSKVLETALEMKIERDGATSSSASAGAGGGGDDDDISVASIRWRACRGSNPNRRGYTCGLWLLFHAVVVNSPRGSALPALRAIRDYIVNYFMCLECRVHFSQMTLPAKRSSEAEQDDDHTAIIWLYRAHNGVNHRLANSGSTDPLVPKVQFPARDLDFCMHRNYHPGVCPSSTQSGENEILQFLRDFYSWKNIQSCLAVKDDQGTDAGGKLAAVDNEEIFSATSSSSSRSMLLFAAAVLLLVIVVAVFVHFRKKGLKFVEKVRVA